MVTWSKDEVATNAVCPFLHFHGEKENKLRAQQDPERHVGICKLRKNRKCGKEDGQNDTLAWNTALLPCHLKLLTNEA